MTCCTAAIECAEYVLHVHIVPSSVCRCGAAQFLHMFAILSKAGLDVVDNVMNGWMQHTL
jgi:hypothetical protein